MRVPEGQQDYEGGKQEEVKGNDTCGKEQGREFLNKGLSGKKKRRRGSKAVDIHRGKNIMRLGGSA